jgi:hypothetical protein
VLWTAAAVFGAGAYRVIGAGGQRAAGLENGSVFNETPQGASLAFRYLRERSNTGRGKAPLVLSQRLGPGRLPSDAVLFRLAPRRVPFAAPDEDENRKRKEKPARSVPLLAPAEEAWVRDGGRLVLGVDASYGPVTVKPAAAAAPVRKTFPVWPGVVTLAPATPLRALSGPIADEAHALFAGGPARILARLPVGRGEVLLCSAPDVLENGRLAQADHLRLLEALAPPERPPAFDEWAHGLGQEQGLLRLLFTWGFGPALATGALAFGLALWRSRARLGPPEQDALEARSEAVDLVASLSQLYDRALSRREAAALDLEGFRRAVALRTGLAGALLEKRARELVGSTLPPLPATGEIPAAELGRRLTTLNDAYRRLHEHAHTRRRP